MNTNSGPLKKNEEELERKSKISSIKEKLSNKLTKFITPKAKGIKEAIEDILDDDKPSSEPLEAGEKAIIRNVLEFKELYVEDVMIPRADIFAIPHDISLEDMKRRIIEKAFTRIPVYKGDLDEVMGFVHIKDIAKAIFHNEKLVIKDIIRKCLFVPGPMKISNLLIRMQQSRVHIAMVVDEYGGTEGLITLEDIIEEIVGRIEDEHDSVADSQIKKLSDNEFETNPRTTIEDFLSSTEIDLSNQYDDEGYDTIGGLVYLIAGRIPVKGEIIKVNEFIEVEVLEADARALRKILVRKKKL